MLEDTIDNLIDRINKGEININSLDEQTKQKIFKRVSERTREEK